MFLVSSYRPVQATALLLVVFVIGFFTRILLFTQAPTPPGDDEAVLCGVASYVLEEGKLPEKNPYHMYGTPFVYPPLMHLLCALTSAACGLSGWGVLGAALWLTISIDTFTTLAVYAVSKRILQSEACSLLCALAYSVASPHLYMMCWGGYVNLLTLFYVPLIVGALLRHLGGDFVRGFLTLTISLTAVFYSHHFSAAITLALLSCTVLALAATRAREKKTLKWFFWASAATASSAAASGAWYIPRYAEFASIFAKAGAEASVSATPQMIAEAASTTILGMGAPFAALLLWLVALGFDYVCRRRGYLGVETICVFTWFLVPSLLGLPFVSKSPMLFQRFFYFSTQPLVILAATGLFYIAVVSARLSDAPAAFATLAVSMLLLGYFLGNFYFIGLRGFYDGNLEWFRSGDASTKHLINWLFTKSEEGCVIASSHSLGWWLSGFSHRGIIPATPAKFLTFPYELDLCRAAFVCVNTCVWAESGRHALMDNGLRGVLKTPQVCVLRAGEVYPGIELDTSKLCVVVREGGVVRRYELSDFEPSRSELVAKGNAVEMLYAYEADELWLRRRVIFPNSSEGADVYLEVGGKEVLEVWVGVDTPLAYEKAYAGDGWVGFFDKAEMLGAVAVFDPEPHAVLGGEEGSYLVVFWGGGGEFRAKISLLVFDASKAEVREPKDWLEEMIEAKVGGGGVEVATVDELMDVYKISYVADQDGYTAYSIARSPRFDLIYSCYKTKRGWEEPTRVLVHKRLL